MNKTYLHVVSIAILFGLLTSCNPKVVSQKQSMPETHFQGNINQRSNRYFDSLEVQTFYSDFPELKKYEEDVVSIYRKHQYRHIWFDNKDVIEFGHSLISKVKNLEIEGIFVSFPYQDKLEGITSDEIVNTLSDVQTEIMLSNLFLFYSDNVYKGVDEKTTEAIGWLLPRKEFSFSELLDSLISDEKLPEKQEEILFSQYYKLRDVLQRYRDIEKTGGWKHIDFDSKLKAYKPGDTARTILQIRERLLKTGDLAQNNQSNKFDDELLAGINKYQVRNGFNVVSEISPKHIIGMNLPISERIKQIVVNMERCRWIAPDIAKAKELLVVNIPAYKLNFFRNGENVFDSKVVVGKNMNKTVIFSGKMSYIVFSPYWNLPQSIINKEVRPEMAKNRNYLENHRMEWNNGQVRQKPGKNNSLGLVKFMFPNSNDIYLHDTPAKGLFGQEQRAFSHGCIRVEKPRDLAITILQDDPNWTPEKIDAAMNAGKETVCKLNEKIPVYIGYFTAWVNPQGEISFYDDVYKRDENLFKLLTESP